MISPKRDCAIGSSISPVTSNEPDDVGNTSGDRELVMSDGTQEREVIPAPEDQEEIRQPKIGRRPMAPTKAEIEEHYPLHLSYRSWCEHCRAGKARQDQHRVEPHDRERFLPQKVYVE